MRFRVLSVAALAVVLATGCSSGPVTPAAAPTVAPTVAAAAKPVATAVAQAAPTVVTAIAQAAPAVATAVAQAAPTVATAIAQAAPAVATAVAQAAPTGATAVAQAAPTVAAQVATAVARPAVAPVTITFWHGMNGSEPGTQGGSLKTLVDQYKQVAPNVTIELDFTPYTANELQQKVTGAIVARNTPDLVQAFESDVAAWYKAGAIAPLDDYVKNSLTAADLDDVQDALLRSGRFPQYENRLLSFPFNRSIYVVYFNKPVLARAGFPDGPRTWDDVSAACARIVADIPCYAVQPSPDSFVPVVWGVGARSSARTSSMPLQRS